MNLGKKTPKVGKWVSVILGKNPAKIQKAVDLSGLKHFKTTEVDLSNSVNLDKNKNPDFRENLIYLCLFEIQFLNSES